MVNFRAEVPQVVKKSHEASIYKAWRALGGENTDRKETKLMLSGEFKHTLDTKNRLFIPAKHREELGATFMVAKSIRENCLKVYSMEEWEEYISPILKLERKASEEVLRTLHRNAAPVSPDAQGRIVIPSALVEYADIQKNAVVVGCGKYAEIWSEETYETMVAAEDLASMKELLESYGL